MPAFFCPRCGARADRDGPCERDGTERLEVTATSLLGTVVGNYVLVEALGEGGMGAVYRAVHPDIGAEVAIKVLHASPTARAQDFLREAQAVNRVRHESLIKIIDTGYLSDRRPYLVMELLDGISLSDVVGKLSFPLACYVAAEALDALDAVHRESVVHRDLKPPNIFLARDGRVVVLDFGIAKLVERGSQATQSANLVGTPEYMAPEQIRAQPLDRRTDIYAMGVLLYETITGRRPFAAQATFDMLLQHLERPPTSPRDYLPSLPNNIAEIILRALEKEPSRRYQTAAEMADALRAALASGDQRDDLAAYVDANARAARPVPLPTPSTPKAPATTPMRGKSDRVAPGDVASTVREVPAPRSSSERALAPSRETAAVSERRTPGHPQQSSTRSRVLWLLGGGALAAAGAVTALVMMRPPAPQQRPPRRGSGDIAALPAPVAVDAALPAAPPDAATFGLLTVTTGPDRAMIFIDGALTGPTPLTIQVSAGQHRVKAVVGTRIAEQDVDVPAGERTNALLSVPAVASPSRSRPLTAAGASTKPNNTASADAAVPPPLTDAAAPTPVTATPPVETQRASDAGTGTSTEHRDNPNHGQRKGNPYKP
ncbi:MAG TPA: serine/threonine-protein kinase [Kofleriaceae bacterium]|nr:serine/threonine-protein kinase [Kofleriaceae bacterium]